MLVSCRGFLSITCLSWSECLSTASERHWQAWRGWTSSRTAQRWWRWRTWIPPSSRWRSIRGMACGRSSTAAARTQAWSSTRRHMTSSSSRRTRPVRTPTASTTLVSSGTWKLGAVDEKFIHFQEGSKIKNTVNVKKWINPSSDKMLLAGADLLTCRFSRFLSVALRSSIPQWIICGHSWWVTACNCVQAHLISNEPQWILVSVCFFSAAAAVHKRSAKWLLFFAAASRAVCCSVWSFPELRQVV